MIIMISIKYPLIITNLLYNNYWHLYWIINKVIKMKRAFNYIYWNINIYLYMNILSYLFVIICLNINFSSWTIIIQNKL